jgi:hypothetical protein
VAQVQLAADGPGDLPAGLERDDLDGDVVAAEGVVVESLPVHVHDEGVSHLGHNLPAGLHQHAGTVDGDVPTGIAEQGEDLAFRRGHRPLYFESFRHGLIVARGREVLELGGRDICRGQD